MTHPHPTAVALIPARSGSVRVRDKNVRPLAGHPLLAYTIAAARASGVFAEVVLSTDSERYAAIARHYGAEVPFLRPAEMAGERSPDVLWVEHALDELSRRGRTYDCFSILRPTSPFRLPSTIRRAWRELLAAEGADSIRAVEKCKQHPGKMWVLHGPRMTPLLPLWPDGHPWHSRQYQDLPEVYVQNASLEIAWTRVIRQGRTIAGHVVAPFLTQGCEGFDINQPQDWAWAEELLRHGEATLPVVDEAPWISRPTAA